MPRLWLPDAVKVRGRDAGEMTKDNGDCKVTIHTEGVDRGRKGRDGNAVSLANYVAAKNIGYHFVYDRAGRFAQLYKPTEGSRALLAGAWSPNRQGKVNIQICFAGIADAHDINDWPLKNWDHFLKFAQAWGVPDRAICNFENPRRSEREWKRSGWTCHAAAPGNDHVDGKGAPIHRLLQSGR